jgi:hypothetical protein
MPIPSTEELEHRELKQFLLDTLSATSSRLQQVRSNEHLAEPYLGPALTQLNVYLNQLHRSFQAYEKQVHDYAEVPCAPSRDEFDPRDTGELNKVGAARIALNESMHEVTQHLKSLEGTLAHSERPGLRTPPPELLTTAVQTLQNILENDRANPVDLERFHERYTKEFVAAQATELERLEQAHQQRLEQQAASVPQGPQQRAKDAPAASPIAAGTPSPTANLAMRPRVAMPSEHGAGTHAQQRPGEKRRVLTLILDKAPNVLRKGGLPGRGRGGHHQ